MLAKKLVAHRGHPHCFPENSLSGLEDAMQRGAAYVECDVQLNAEHQVYVCHDDELYRTAAIQLNITEASSEQLQAIKVGEPARFGPLFELEPLPTLSQFIGLLQRYPQVHAMVEIKQESVEVFGAQTCVDAIVPFLAGVKEQVIVIADDALSLQLSRERGYTIGWIVHEYSDAIHNEVSILEPDYLICNHKYLPALQAQYLWPGPWRWVFYQTDDPQLARDLMAMGADLVETNSIGEMLEQLAQ